MPHCSEEMRFDEFQKKLGKTGQFPNGKITIYDEGEIKLGLAIKDNIIVMAFGEKPIKWIGFEPKQARDIAYTLNTKADEIEFGANQELKKVYKK